MKSHCLWLVSLPQLPSPLSRGVKGGCCRGSGFAARRHGVEGIPRSSTWRRLLLVSVEWAVDLSLW